MTPSNSVAAQFDSLGYAESRPKAFAGLAILAILFTSNVYDPSGALHVKYASFCLAASFSIWALRHVNLSAREILFGLLLFVVWPLWSLLYGAVRRGDVIIGISQVTPFLFALLLAPVLFTVEEKRPLRLFYACLFSLAILVIALFGVVALFPDTGLSARIFGLLSSLHEQEGYFGTKTVGDMEVVGIYFASTLFLVPTCVYYLFVRKFLRAMIAFLALALAFSKAGILILLVFGLIYSAMELFSGRVSESAKRVRVGRSIYFRAASPVILLGGLVWLLLLWFPAFSNQIVDMLTGESETAQIRLGHMNSWLKLFESNPHYLLFGQGVGVPFYTTGESEYVQNVEVDHLNTIRKFGFPWFIGFTALVFYSSRRLIKSGDRETRAFGFALISMYFAAGTNPVLLSPLFIILLTLSYFAQRPANAIAS